MKLEVHGSAMAVGVQNEVRSAWQSQSRLKVKNSYKIRRKVHSSATAGAR